MIGNTKDAVIESQESKIKALEAKNAELEKKLHEANMRSAPEIEKRLEIAVEALKYVDGWWYTPHLYIDTIAEIKMKEALAAINGEGL